MAQAVPAAALSPAFRGERPGNTAETVEAVAAQATLTTGQASPGALFASGLRAGLLTFGGAYTAIPFLQEDAVERGQWMTQRDFLDGVAMSGILPAPLIIFSTFVGYVGGGALGAVTMTVGVFLPAFLFTMLFYRHLEAVIANVLLRHVLEGVTAGVVGLIAMTAVHLAVVAIPNAKAAVIFTGALLLIYCWQSKLTVPAVVLVGGFVGWLWFRS